MDKNDPLESEEFYNLCQGYRFAPPARQDITSEAWEDIKKFIRKNYVRKEENHE